MFHIVDIQKSTDGLSFEKTVEVQADLQERNKDILALSPVSTKGRVRFESGLFFLEYEMTYTITLASSRSLEPVALQEIQQVQELFVASESTLKEQELIDEDLVLVLEGDYIVLEESVADNILLAIPNKVLTPEEAAGKDLPAGQDWVVMTEETYRKEAKAKKEAASPFAQLQGLFDQD